MSETVKNPIFRKEVKQYARSRRAMWILAAFNLILQLIGLFSYYISFVYAEKHGIGVRYADILTVYRILAMTEFLLIVCIVPAVSAGAVCGEKERQTFDLLMSTPLTPFQIVTGKLMASLHIVLVLIISSLPVFGLVFSVGGIDFKALLSMYACLMLQTVVLGSISITISVFCRRTTTASVVSYLVMVLLILGTLLLTAGCYVFLGEDTEYVTFEAVYRGWITEGVAEHNWNLLLLGNPFCGFLALLKEQTGRTELLLLEYGSRGGIAEVIREHWSAVSMGLQAAAAVVLNICSVRKLSKVSYSG
ncbi:MAG: ABC transporter permease [Lachnospiraceae bacterium]